MVHTLIVLVVGELTLDVFKVLLQLVSVTDDLFLHLVSLILEVRLGVVDDLVNTIDELVSSDNWFSLFILHLEPRVAVEHAHPLEDGFVFSLQ